MYRRRNKGWKLAGLAVAAGVAYAFISMWPDLQRYIKTEMM